MELKRDLLKKDRKSAFRLIIGILCIVISIAWIVDRFIDNLAIRPFDWFYTGIFALNGIVHSSEGSGFSFLRLFGKAFVLIDNDLISIKTGLFDREQKVSWKDIKALEYKLNKFHIVKLDDTYLTLDLSKLDYSLKNDIKVTIEFIAREKFKII